MLNAYCIINAYHIFNGMATKMLTVSNNARRTPAEHEPLLLSFWGMPGRIGLLGGSFDPVHTSHVILAELAVKELKLDACVFIPAHQNPLKHNAPQANDRQRLAMLRLALENKPGLYVSPMELVLGSAAGGAESPSYTADTLSRIKKEIDPQAELFLLLGSDLIKDLHRWHDLDGIFKLCTPAPLMRKGWEIEDLRRANPLLDIGQLSILERNFIKTPTLENSSSLIRDKFRAGCAAPPGLAPEVLNYIRQQQLYGTSIPLPALT